MNSIIFLDIDGVLCINFTKGTEHRNTDKYGDHFDPECVNQLKRITDATGAEVNCRLCKESPFQNLEKSDVKLMFVKRSDYSNEN